jgi:putative peptidoglycan lipid II flippase
LICLAALVAGVLNGMERFTAASASYVLFNVVSMAFMIGLTPYVPTAGHALAWGVTASGVAQLGLLLIASARAGMALRLPRPRMTPQMRILLRRMVPGLVGAGVTQLNLAVDVVISSLLPAGTVAVLYYADRVNQLPLGVIGTAIGTALLPTLSRQVRSGEAAAAIATINRALELALALTLPAAAALIVSGFPIIWTLFGRGAFGAEDALFSSQSLAAYAVGLPAFVAVKVLAPAFFARGDTATPVKIGIGCVVLNLMLNVAFMTPLRHVGPALATSVSSTVNVAALGIVLVRNGHLQLDARLLSRAPRIAGATLAMAGVLTFAGHTLFADPSALPHQSGVSRMIGLAITVAAGLGAYGAVGQLLGAFDVRLARDRLSRRFLRRAPVSVIAARPSDP